MRKEERIKIRSEHSAQQSKGKKIFLQGNMAWSQEEGIDKLPKKKNIWHGTGPSFPYKCNARNISATWNNDCVKEISSLFYLSSFLVGFLYIQPMTLYSGAPSTIVVNLAGTVDKKRENLSCNNYYLRAIHSRAAFDAMGWVHTKKQGRGIVCLKRKFDDYFMRK